MGANLTPLDFGPDFNVSSLSRGGGGFSRHHCAMSDDDAFKCFGWNDYGQLGLGDEETRGDEPGEMGAALPFVPTRQPTDTPTTAMPTRSPTISPSTDPSTTPRNIPTQNPSFAEPAIFLSTTNSSGSGTDIEVSDSIDVSVEPKEPSDASEDSEDTDLWFYVALSVGVFVLCAVSVFLCLVCRKRRVDSEVRAVESRVTALTAIEQPRNTEKENDNESGNDA